MTSAYAKTRWNAVTWGVHFAGPMPCRPSRCPYRRYRGGQSCGDVPILGDLCHIEVEYAEAFERSFRRQFAKPFSWPEETWDELAAEAVDILLKLQRATLRSNMAWEVGDITSQPAQKEIRLADRAMAQQLNRWQQVLEKLEEAHTETAELNERLQAAVGPRRP
jgi:hypothetical protein